MTKKVTVVSHRLREVMEKRSMDGRELSRRSGLKYDDITNILAGRSRKTDKLTAIAKTFDLPLTYFLGIDDQDKESLLNYDAELHCKTMRFVYEHCKKNKIYLTKEKMDDLVSFIYPRLKQSDSDELISVQVEALANYYLVNKVN